MTQRLFSERADCCTHPRHLQPQHFTYRFIVTLKCQFGFAVYLSFMSSSLFSNIARMPIEAPLKPRARKPPTDISIAPLHSPALYLPSEIAYMNFAVSLLLFHYLYDNSVTQILFLKDLKLYGLLQFAFPDCSLRLYDSSMLLHVAVVHSCSLQYNVQLSE